MDDGSYVCVETSAAIYEAVGAALKGAEQRFIKDPR
jgi:hypothetical protein